MSLSPASLPDPKEHSACPPWHFPFGPSTKYHQREQTRPHHTRHNSAYTPTAPNLSTERRAHRRVHTQKSSLSDVPPPSRFASYSTSGKPTSAATMLASNGALPTTPAKPRRRRSSLHNSSPFSDYCTDEARSEDTHLAGSDTKHLLVRMNKLQSQLMRNHQVEREQNSEAIRIVGSKLSEIELELSSLHSQTRLPVEIEDSMVGAAEHDAHAKGNSQPQHDPYLYDASTELRPHPVTIEQFKAERDWFILRMQDLVSGLHAAQVELGKRFAEVRELNDKHNAESEHRETQLEELRAENECLRSEAGFEYSELLFLKLQMKSLEVDVDMLSDDIDVSDTTATKDRRAKKNRILAEMDRWRADWQDVNGRFKRRRSKYGVSPERCENVSQDGSSPNGDEVEWHLETIKEGRGRVTSLTIKRMDSSYGGNPEGSIDEDRLADSTLGESLYGTAKKSTPLDASIDFSASTTDAASPAGAHSLATSPTRKGTSHAQTTEPLTPIPSHREDLPLHQASITGSDEDCAITTSSEASEDEQDRFDAEHVEAQPLSASPPSKTAWQELWESLANLSGMTHDHFED